MERIKSQLQRKYVVDKISDFLINSLLLVYYRLKQYVNSQRYAFRR